ncbi:uncharacterized protein YecT (DUF1311 family) [Acinetobacter calcoaceticus]|uniref:Uncharacterized protein YecT (DUF1311 family) n=1 Tax=Acinetobacter calcoaceticus TaxID=471 RepID=A0A4R1X9G7_ACICA|nr:uncharacterized protein YecT (DUF1311 family) [Acinetobacter calcoaceticus]
MNKLFPILLIVLSSKLYANSPTDFLYKNVLNVECKEGSPLQDDLMYCLSRYYLESDAELNKTYNNKINSLSHTKIKKLRESQRSWLKNKNIDCSDAYEAEKDGREAPINYLFCHAEANDKRVLFLEHYK